MANDLTAVIPKLLAQGMMAMRQQAIMPRLVNRGYESLAGQKGSTIDVPIASAIAIQAVTAAATPPSTADVAATSVAITLDQWWEAPFTLSDKERMQVMDGFLPMQATEAIKTIANKIDNDLLALYNGVYGYTGTAGTTPFASDLSDATKSRTILFSQLAPPDDRRVVLSPDAEGNALLVRGIQDASFGGGPGALMRGQIGFRLGMDWWMDQNVPTHTAGTLPGTPLVNGAVSAGLTSITLSGLTISLGVLNVGDVLFFSAVGHLKQNYVVVSAATTGTSGIACNVSPPLVANLASGGSALLRASHVVNLTFHRDAFALAMRPLEQEGENVMTATDPVSGLSMRLEVTREYKRWRYSYDVLYGVKLVRPEFACRIAG